MLIQLKIKYSKNLKNRNVHDARYFRFRDIAVTILNENIILRSE